MFTLVALATAVWTKHPGALKSVMQTERECRRKRGCDCSTGSCVCVCVDAEWMTKYQMLCLLLLKN